MIPLASVVALFFHILSCAAQVQTDQCKNFLCENGGSCVIGKNCPVCECLPEYFGPHCEYMNNPSCEGYCLNGGQCERFRAVQAIRCRCPEPYTGKRCEMIQGTCPAIDLRSVGTCQGKICSNDRDCFNTREKCCPSPCGGLLCTKVEILGEERWRHQNTNRSRMLEHTRPKNVVIRNINGGYGVKEDPNSHSCKGICLNGGMCVRNLPDDYISCHCHINFTGNRCQFRAFDCPKIVSRSDGKCDGTPCRYDEQCEKPGDQCCPSACGGNVCTSGNITRVNQRSCDGFCYNRGRCWRSIPDDELHCNCRNRYTGNRCETFRGITTTQRPTTRPAPQREPHKDLVSELGKSSKLYYTNPYGTYGVIEDPSSPACKNFCLNGARCVRNMPENFISCHCQINYSGKRCETYTLSCPVINPRSDGTCKGIPCSTIHDCGHPQAECCPSACGGKICTIVNSPYFRPRSCDGFCLNGGRCWRQDPDAILFCLCPKGYTGRRCEIFTGSCLIIDGRSDDKCDGKVCSDDQDCIDQGGQCCPRACGQKQCTDANDSAIWKMAVRERQQILDRMLENKQPAGFSYYTRNGSWGMTEAPNSVLCPGFCLNEGRCERNFPQDELSCVCSLPYDGKRCEKNMFACPAINSSSGGQCEGTPCSIDHDCVNPREECCPNACGGKTCTNVNAPVIKRRSCDGFCLNGGWCSYSLSLRGLKCDCPETYTGKRCETFRNITTQRPFTRPAPKRKTYREIMGEFGYSELYRYGDGGYGVLQDPNSPACKNFCLNGARCVRNFPKDFISCKCEPHYSGERCEIFTNPCPPINPKPGRRCKYKPCYTERDCDSSDEECCPSTCGGNICTNVRFPVFRPKTCEGFCLNGGRCWQEDPDAMLFCLCPKGYTGRRCENLTGFCPIVNPRSDGKCEGKVCSNHKDCTDQGGQCCPNACGQKICTNANNSVIWKEAVRERQQILDSMLENKKPKGFLYFELNGSWQMEEDSNSVSCKGLCLNDGRCVRNFPQDEVSCKCHLPYHGERCENHLYACPAINSSSGGQCEGTPCSIDHDCVNPREECCPNACGGKTCTDVNRLVIKQRTCDGFCLNGGRCLQRNMDDHLRCRCRAGYTGNRCETPDKGV